MNRECLPVEIEGLGSIDVLVCGTEYHEGWDADSSERRQRVLVPRVIQFDPLEFFLGVGAPT